MGSWISDKRGQSLVELVITVGVFAVVGGAAVMLVLNSLRSGTAGGDRTAAVGYARGLGSGEIHRARFVQRARNRFARAH